MRPVRSRMTYANLMATIAVFIALGGTGYAVSQLPKNSVKAKQIAKDAVGASEIKAGAVGSPEVADGSLSATDFGSGQIPAGPAGATGPGGATGPHGATGPAGPTFAAVQDSLDPSVSPDGGNLTDTILTFTLPSAGKILARFDAVKQVGGVGGVQISCSAGLATVGLYVDGVAVRDTAYVLSSGVAATFAVAGIAGPLAAGSHTLALRADCSTGNLVTTSVDTESFTSVLLLGS